MTHSLPKFWMSLAGAVLAVGLAGQAPAADTASVKVTVTGQDGKPAASVPVRLLIPAGATPATPAPAEKAPTDKTPADKKPVVEKAAPADKPAVGDVPARPTKVQETTTDDKGKATLTKVAAGDYVVAAGKKDAGQGRQKVSIKEGETVDVAISLKAPKAK